MRRESYIGLIPVTVWGRRESDKELGEVMPRESYIGLIPVTNFKEGPIHLQ